MVPDFFEVADSGLQCKKFAARACEQLSMLLVQEES